MERRKVLALTGSIGTAALAGCASILNGDDDSPTENDTTPETNTTPEQNGTSTPNETETQGPPEDLQTPTDEDRAPINIIEQFYNAWLHTDVEKLTALLHEPRALFKNEEQLSELPSTNFNVNVEFETVGVVQRDIPEQTLVDFAASTDTLSEDEARTIAETETRSYYVVPEFTGEINPETEAEQQIVDDIQQEATRLVSIQDGNWRIV